MKIGIVIAVLILSVAVAAAQEGKVYTDKDLVGQDYRTDERIKRDEQQASERLLEYETDAKERARARAKEEERQRDREIIDNKFQRYNNCLKTAQNNYIQNWQQSCRSFGTCIIRSGLSQDCTGCDLSSDIAMLHELRLSSDKNDCHHLYKPW